jgi:hypothetical protein
MKRLIVPIVAMFLASPVAAQTYVPGGGPSLGPAATAAAGQIPGTATNDNASTGNIGEYSFANLARSSAITLTTATAANVTSISLTAGDWDVSGQCGLLVGASTVTTQIRCGISTTTATLPSADSGAQAAFPSIAGGAFDFLQNTPTFRVSLATTTTVYLISYVAFTSTAPTVYGNIRARRVR